MDICNPLHNFDGGEKEQANATCKQAFKEMDFEKVR